MRGDPFTEEQLNRIGVDRTLAAFGLKVGDVVGVDLLVTVRPDPENGTHGPCRLVGTITGATRAVLVMHTDGPPAGTFRVPWPAIACVWQADNTTAHPALEE